jgi:nicotinic acid mononucleotide adenylyltransferase
VTVCAYPGSFNPPTVAHLAIVDAVLARGFDRVELIVSQVALGKGTVERPRFEERMGLLHQVAAHRTGLSVVATEDQLLADIAQGYDALVVGEDKLRQILDPTWYGSPEACDEALGRLPRLLVVPRPTEIGPGSVSLDSAGYNPAILPGIEVVTLPGELAQVSSTGARAGRIDWMVPEARAFQLSTGAWTPG